MAAQQLAGLVQAQRAQVGQGAGVDQLLDRAAQAIDLAEAEADGRGGQVWEAQLGRGMAARGQCAHQEDQAAHGWMIICIGSIWTIKRKRSAEGRKSLSRTF